MPQIEELIKTHLKRMEDRFGRLFFRTAIESGATKRLIIRVLLELRTASPDEIKAMADEAWQRSRLSLKDPLESLEEYVASLRSNERE